MAEGRDRSHPCEFYSAELARLIESGVVAVDDDFRRIGSEKPMVARVNGLPYHQSSDC